ncbi:MULTISPECIES: hypothetical protein [unclassified Streptomyces]|uniref:hypothetical protein n=1 Tax=unclassified Streptomyces TaxID=2593676 RepID=UPI003655F177
MGARQFNSDPFHRISEYQMAGVNARAQVHAVLAAAGLSAEAADELMCAIEAGAVAGAQRQLVERAGSAPSERRECDDLVDAADFLCQQHGIAASTRQFLTHQLRRQAAAQPTPASTRTGEEGETPPELVEQALAACEQHYAAVTATSSQQWDTELSRELVGIALRTVRLAERADYPQALEKYLRENRERLQRLWHRYGPSGTFAQELVLINLPACFALCERIDSAPMWLDGMWDQEGHEETTLERLHDAWLYDTRDREGDGR